MNEILKRLLIEAGILYVFVFAILVILLFMFSGCAQLIIETDDVFIKVNTIFKDIDFEKIQYGKATLKKYTGESKNVKVITPVGGFKTGD